MSVEVAPELSGAGTQSRVAKNTLIYFISQVLTWVVTILTISVIPRRLGESAMGQITIAATIVNLVMGVFTAGIESYLTKEFGRDRSQTERLIRATMGLRIVVLGPSVLISLVSLLLFVGVAPHQNFWQAIWTTPGKSPLLVLGLINIAQLPSMFFASPLGAMMTGWEEARIFAVISLLLNTAAIFALPFLEHGAVSVVGANLFCWMLVWLICWAWARRLIRLSPVFDPRLWRRLIRNGIPFMVNGYVMALHVLISVIALRHFGGDAAVGVYNQAGRLTGIALALPTALASALLPAISRLADLQPDEFKRVQSRVLGLLVLIGLPCTILLFMLAHPLSHLIYGRRAFHDLGPVLQASSLSILPVYIVTIIYQFLVAQDRAKLWTRFLLGTVAINGLGCMLLIPLAKRWLHNPGVGAALAILIAESCTVLFAFQLLKFRLFGEDSSGRLVRTLIAGALMVLTLWLTRSFFVLIPAVLGVLVYMALVWRLRLLTEQEQAMLNGLIRRKLAKIHR